MCYNNCLWFNAYTERCSKPADEPCPEEVEDLTEWEEAKLDRELERMEMESYCQDKEWEREVLGKCI